MKKVKRVAVALGTDHQNTLGVIRSLGEAGFFVIAVIFGSDANPNCSTAKSKYISELFCINSIDNAKESFDDIKNEYCKNEKIPVVPCGDGATLFLEKYRSELASAFLLPYSGKYSFEDIMDKARMFEILQDADVNVPKFKLVENFSMYENEKLIHSFGYPCIIKPIEVEKGSDNKYLILKTEEEYNSAKEILSSYRKFIIQRYVHKKLEYGVCACRLNNSSKTIFGGVIKKIRFSQDSLGSTTAGIIEQEAGKLTNLSEQIVESLDYHGIFDIEYIWDGTQWHFVEINLRNGGYGYAYTRAGRNFPAIWCSEAVGDDYSKYLLKNPRKIFFINETADMKNIKAGNESVLRYFWDFLRANVRLYFNSKDLKPFFSKLFR